MEHLIETLKSYPHLIQICMLTSLFVGLVCAKFFSEPYTRKALLAINILIAVFGISYGVEVGDYYASVFFILLAATGIYLGWKTTPSTSHKKLLYIWLTGMFLIILIFSVFKHVYFADYIRFSIKLHLLGYHYIRWYLVWGVFIVWSVWYWVKRTKTSPLAKRVVRAQTLGIILFAFWVTFFSFKALGKSFSTMDNSDFFYNKAFAPITRHLYYGFSPHARNLYWETRFHTAVEKGNLEKVKAFIANGADVNRLNHHRHETPLHTAIAKRHYGMFMYLLNHGADIHAPTCNGIEFQPIHLAVIYAVNNDLRYVSELIKRGADVNAKNRYGATPINDAIRSKRGKDGKLYLQEELIELLIQYGADVNANGSHGTPLHYAVFHIDILAIRKLIELGAGPSLRNQDGHTPLEQAKYHYESAITHNEDVVSQRKQWLPIIHYLESVAPHEDKPHSAPS